MPHIHMQCAHSIYTKALGLWRAWWRIDETLHLRMCQRQSQMNFVVITKLQYIADSFWVLFGVLHPHTPTSPAAFLFHPSNFLPVIPIIHIIQIVRVLTSTLKIIIQHINMSCMPRIHEYNSCHSITFIQKTLCFHCYVVICYQHSHEASLCYYLSRMATTWKYNIDFCGWVAIKTNFRIYFIN